MSGPGIVIDSPEALDRFVAGLPRVLPGPPGPLVLRSLPLSPSPQGVEEDRLNRLYDACGCDMGAAVALAAVALYLAVVLQGWAGEIGALGATAGGLLVFFLAGAAGKVVGLVWARRRLVRLLLEYRPLFQAAGELDRSIAPAGGSPDKGRERQERRCQNSSSASETMIPAGRRM